MNIDGVTVTATYARGIGGGNIVGEYLANGIFHGFIYDGSTHTTLDVPGAYETIAQGIDGSGNIVGHYLDDTYYGFQAIPVVPLPPAAWMALTMLGGIGGYGLVRRRLCPVNTSL